MQSSQPRPRKRLDQVRDVIRVKHDSYRMEELYVQWIRRYILVHNQRHPKEMGVPAIEAFLTHLAVQEQVADLYACVESRWMRSAEPPRPLKRFWAPYRF